MAQYPMEHKIGSREPLEVGIWNFLEAERFLCVYAAAAGRWNDISQSLVRTYPPTSRALPGFPGDLQHWLEIRGGNTIQKYFYNPNFIPIGQ